jgi:hypothetical protein
MFRTAVGLTDQSASIFSALQPQRDPELERFVPEPVLAAN